MDCTIQWQRGISNIDLLHVWERGGSAVARQKGKDESTADFTK